VRKGFEDIPGFAGIPDVADIPGVAGLPAVETLPRLRAALRSPGEAILVAPPGAGKTTVAPLGLLEEPWLGARRVVVLEPRRLAARAAARRMSQLLGESSAGGTVGYRVRGEVRSGPGTRIELVTEGILTRMLQSDPALSDVGLVVFDEFHERSLHGDLGLALTLHARSLLRQDLRILIMSATLDAERVSALLGGAPVVESRGRVYPVETRWRRHPTRGGVGGGVEGAVVAAVGRALAEEDGDVLVFLPGAGEIRRTEARLRALDLEAEVDVRPLFGHLSGDEQDAAIAPSPPGRRKVVLATAIAETSLTIEGVRVVVDSGLMRVPRFDAGTGMSGLVTLRVTRDSADQRRGRAGRTAPGVCYRLWTRAEDHGLVPHRLPEIQEADLAPLALELAVWGARPDELIWLDPPPGAAFAQGVELLRALGAVDEAGFATPHGRRMARLGLHPRLAHMLLRGQALGLIRPACELAALLAERDPVRSEEGFADADLRLRLEALEAYRAGRSPTRVLPRGHRADQGALARVAREAARLVRILEADSGPAVDAGAEPAMAGDAEADPNVLVALAYPDRIGQRRPGSRTRFLLRNGRGARLEGSSALESAEWMVAAEVEGHGRDARIFRAAPLTRAAVEAHFGDQAEKRDDVYWDDAAGRVVGRRRRMLGALILAEGDLPEPDADAVADAFLGGLQRAGLEGLPWTKSSRQLLDRLRFLHHVDPDRWPNASDAALLDSLEEWLLPFLPGARRLSDLQRVDLEAALLSRVPRDRTGQLVDLAPTHIRVPSGSRIPVDYSDPTAPSLAVRLQEVFGLLATPTIAGGRVPVTMTLLSPAHRPVQVTRDLASFWSDAYFEVRKDLRGRYPKHHWPEDPLTATPTRRARPGGGAA
jgi:ATP-dependent helicase HrpB